MDGTLFAQAASSSFDWSHVLAGCLGSVAGLVAAPFFQYLIQKRITDQKAKLEIKAQADKIELEMTDRAFLQGEKIRNDLMAEILENRKQVSDLQRDNLQYQRENIELKVKVTSMATLITALQEENARLHAHCETLQHQLDSWGPVTPTEPASAPSAQSEIKPPMAAEQAAELAMKAADVATKAANSSARSAQDAANSAAK